MTLVLTAFIAVTYREENEHIAEDFARSVQAAQGYFRATLDQRADKLGAVLETLAGNGPLHAALKQRDRDALLSQSLPLFQHLQKQYGITHFYFEDPKRVNLLRVHQPARYGDTINRFTTLAAERTGKVSHGIELGPLGTFTLRAVAPAHEGDHLLGYIELGEEVSDAIHDLQALFQLDLIVAIDKRYLNRADWETGMNQLGHKAEWDRFPGAVITAETLGAVQEPLVALLSGLPGRAPGNDVELAWNKHRYRGRFLPLEDAGGRQVGSLMVLRDMSARIQSNYDTLFWIGAGALALGSLLFGFFFFVLDRAEREIKTNDGGNHPIAAPRHSMLTLLVALVLTIFIAELAIMLALPDSLPAVWTALIAASLLVVLLHPTLYFLVLRPLSLSVEQRLLAEKASTHLGHILDESTNEIYTFDGASLRFLEVSRGACNNLGYSLGELKQLTPLGIKPEFNREQFETLIDPLRLGTEERIDFETVHHRKDGSHYPVEVHLLYSQTVSPPVFIAIVQDISERQRYITELEHKAQYDSLTGLPNRNLLADRLQHDIAFAHRETKPLAIVVLDIARLKEVNDTLGYQNGDLVLREVASRLQLALRESDTVARLGGDEFALLLPGVDAGSIGLVVAKIQKTLEAPVLIDRFPLNVEVSMGITVYPLHGDEPGLLLQHADVAMRQAKSEVSGFHIYESIQDPYSRRRLKLLGELRSAIAQHALVLYYQPKVNIGTGRVTAVEALARWPHAEDGMVFPDEFIPLAETTGLIHPLTLWALEEAIRQCSEWREMGYDLKVAVNLSARNLLDPTLPDTFATMLDSHHVAADRLMLEVTESAVMAKPDQALRVLTRLHEMGAGLSIDDFGTGYSSLAYLKKLPVDELKIDRSFISGLVENENDALIVHSSIELAHSFGLTVVAEGVENQLILDVLAALKCDTGQGYHFARPMPPDEFSRWLSESPWGLPKKGT